MGSGKSLGIGLSLLATSALALGCGHDKNPFIRGHATTVGDGPDSGLLHLPPPTPPSPDAGGLCGNDVVPVVVDRPNLYFILDDSGSMSTLMPQGTAPVGNTFPSRYLAARAAIRSLLRAVGHRVSYGASIFPGEAAGCSPPKEVFPTVPGDAVSYARSGRDGPVLTNLLVGLAKYPPDGLTPTALALSSLKNTLAALPGTTFAFLLTDGAPNCNDAAACGADQCTANIEDACPIAGNCCDPGSGYYDYRWCLDSDPTVQAVADLRTAGVRTYVVGMPGTAAYAALLDRMADAGGTARDGAVKYYPTASADELSDTLSQIGLAVALSCDLPLKEAPPNPHLVNVFFDQNVLTFGDPDGWEWADEKTVRVVGRACEDLKSGQTSQVQIVAGCPSVTR